MTLLQLPFELQLLILHYVKHDNHLDLAPIAQTCKFYYCLVSDKHNWSNTVTILPTDAHSPSIKYMVDAFKKNNRLLTRQLKIIANDHNTVPLIFSILKKQQYTNTIEDINITMPAKYHRMLYQTLHDYPQTNIKHFSICDIADDGYIMSPKEDHMLLLQFLSTTLSKSQLTLKTLDFSSFPSNILVSQSNQYQFPSVTVLNIALTDVSQQENQHHFWRRMKHMFPYLAELRLNLTRDQISLFKFLLNDLSLFPWVKRLTVQSVECPKTYLSRDELRNSLLQLNGLNRITAGWDMIALN